MFLEAKKLKNKNKYRLITKSTLSHHRYGWPIVLDAMSKLSFDEPIVVCDFVDHTFKKDDEQSKILQVDRETILCSRGYNLFKNNGTEICCTNNKYYEWDSTQYKWEKKALNKVDIQNICLERYATFRTNKWIGFVHNPVRMPKYFDYNQNIKSILTNTSFTDCLHNCIGIFVLSNDLKTQLDKVFNYHNIKIPIISIKHPTIINSNKWDFDMFLATKNFVQLGYWLRKSGSFWNINTHLCKTWLYGNSFAFEILKQENIDITNNVYITNVPNTVYDKYMRSSLVYLNYHNASASNAILDCISYATPLLVNKLPSIVEYLGKKYPLYYNSITQASKFTRDNKRILDAHDYLMDKKLTDQFSISKFQKDLKDKIDRLCKK